MAAHRPHIGTDGHTIVIKDHNQRFAGGTGIIQALKAETAAQCTIPDQRQHIIILMLHGAGPRHTQRDRHGV